MDTSNRQVGKDKVSDRVAMVANLKKVGCDELTSKEWVELIGVALKHAKPHFKYVPHFLPVIERSVNVFHLRPVSAIDRWRVPGSWSRDSYDINIPDPSDDSSTAGVLQAFRVDAKVVEICEISYCPEQNKSIKVMLNMHGIFILAYCQRSIGVFAARSPVVYNVEILSSDIQLEKVISQFPQIGPLTLFAVSAIINDAYEKKIEVLENLNGAGQRLHAICANVNMCDGHFIQKHPWGVSDGES